MRVRLDLVSGLLCLMATKTAFASPPYQFVLQYTKTLAEIEQVRDGATEELKQKSGNVFADCIHNGTKLQIEWQSAVSDLKATDLGDNVAKEVVPGLISFYQQEMQIDETLVSNCQKMLVQQPGIGYARLAGDMPKLTAIADYADQSIFKTTPLVFSSMIDPKPDTEGHLSRLVITKGERANLVGLLNLYFGRKMAESNQNWLVSSATVLRDYLTKKGYKAADER